jgi:hypothetical protein
MMLIGLTGCDPFRPNQLAPSLPVAYGVRVTNGKLRIWTGSPCLAATKVKLTFNADHDTRADLTLRTPLATQKIEPPAGTTRNDIGPDPGVDVEYLTIGGPYSGFDVVEALPQGFDWRTAKTLLMYLDGPNASWGASGDLSEAITGSAQHPDDTYWFQGVGWLNPAGVTARDGKDFLALCTPDPAKNAGLPRVFGVRVTDGMLRVWPGPSCDATSDVILTFRPGKVDLVLRENRDSMSSFQYVTVGEPPQAFHVSQPLPADFDWHTENSVLLRVVDLDVDYWTTLTDLTPVITESPRHPADTYWFQGFGWLNPTQVASRDGNDLLTTCAQRPAPR